MVATGVGTTKAKVMAEVGGGGMGTRCGGVEEKGSKPNERGKRKSRRGEGGGGGDFERWSNVGERELVTALGMTQ